MTSIPDDCTPERLLTSCLDISGPVKPATVYSLAQLCTDEEEKKAMLVLSSETDQGAQVCDTAVLLLSSALS
jgi:hypothetical protein